MNAEETHQPVSNQSARRGASSSAGAGRTCAAPVRHLRRVSERGATTTPGRWSDPAPLPNNGPRREGMRCRRCGRVKPPLEFVLRDDPTARERGWATRDWCADCLVERGHITEQRAERLRRQAMADEDTQARKKAARDRARRVVRGHRITVQLVDRAMTDPVYEAAILRAAEQLQVRATA